MKIILKRGFQFCSPFLTNKNKYDLAAAERFVNDYFTKALIFERDYLKSYSELEVLRFYDCILRSYV